MPSSDKRQPLPNTCQQLSKHFNNQHKSHSANTKSYWKKNNNTNILVTHNTNISVTHHKHLTDRQTDTQT